MAVWLTADGHFPTVGQRFVGLSQWMDEILPWDAIVGICNGIISSQGFVGDFS